eukprot:jgi/Tetstr1/461475/TSEL_006581.t1
MADESAPSDEAASALSSGHQAQDPEEISCEQGLLTATTVWQAPAVGSMMRAAATLLALLALSGWAAIVGARDSPADVLELVRLTEDPAGGYHGHYDIRVVGLKYNVQVYYFIPAGTKQFYFKSTGSGVDIPWCGPANFDLKDNGDGTSEIIVTGEDPHCGAEQEKAHPVKELSRVFDHASNKIVMSMKVYTVWPVGWKDIKADCNACATEDCVMS